MTLEYIQAHSQITECLGSSLNIETKLHNIQAILANTFGSSGPSITLPISYKDISFGNLAFEMAQESVTEETSLFFKALASQIGQDFYRLKMESKLKETHIQLSDFVENGSLPLH